MKNYIFYYVVGIVKNAKTKALQFRKFDYSTKNTVSSLFDKNLHSKDKGSAIHFQAVTTDVAGKIGTESTVGHATTLVLGGRGAVFWMWISALFGMVTKYSEIVLSIKYREKNEEGTCIGGPMYYIKNGLNVKWLAILFAIFAMIACIGTGNARQSNAMSDVAKDSLNIPSWVTGLILTVIVVLVILGGIKRIASVNEKLVPSMAIFFVIIAMLCLCFNAPKIPQAFALIFKEAFNFKAGFGGVASYSIMTAI